MDVIDGPEGYDLHAFPCFYYSQYKEESEYLLFGGHYQIRVNSIRNMITQNNYQSFIKPLAQFEKIFNGSRPYGMSVSDICVVKCLCDSVFGFVVDFNKNKKIKKYIYKCFKAYSQNKTYIVLNTDYIKDTYKEFRNMIFYDIKKYKYDDDKILSVSDRVNVFKSDLFRLLPNLQTIVFITTDWNGYFIYPFSFLCLLNEIYNNSKLKKVIIKATRKNKEKESWLLWSKEEVIKIFANKNYKTTFKTQKNSFGDVEDCVIICKDK